MTGGGGSRRGGRVPTWRGALRRGLGLGASLGLAVSLVGCLCQESRSAVSVEMVDAEGKRLCGSVFIVESASPFGGQETFIPLQEVSFGDQGCEYRYDGGPDDYRVEARAAGRRTERRDVTAEGSASIGSCVSEPGIARIEMKPVE